MRKERQIFIKIGIVWRSISKIACKFIFNVICLILHYAKNFKQSKKKEENHKGKMDKNIYKTIYWDYKPIIRPFSFFVDKI